MQRLRASQMFCPRSLLRPARGAGRAPRPPPPRAGGRRRGVARHRQPAPRAEVGPLSSRPLPPMAGE
eukprot:4283826-Alexandrium_andersonii.AAC.1